ncbi:hypothetical protein BDZ91DRAFT_766564 [Kalaharituber pfeilii]|nr:hypothetical protein BDZ91DRAFT_766564 [Kalaharituber pfeilii]
MLPVASEIHRKLGLAESLLNFDSVVLALDLPSGRAVKQVEEKFAGALQHLRQLIDNGIEGIQKELEDLQQQVNQLRSHVYSSRAAVNNTTTPSNRCITQWTSSINGLSRCALTSGSCVKQSTFCRWLESNYPVLENALTLPQNAQHIAQQTTITIDLTSVDVESAEPDFGYSRSIDSQANVNINHGATTQDFESPGAYEMEVAVQTQYHSQINGNDPRGSYIEIPNFSDAACTLGRIQNQQGNTGKGNPNPNGSIAG